VCVGGGLEDSWDLMLYPGRVSKPN
jgi:hypothetical protein